MAILSNEEEIENIWWKQIKKGTSYKADSIVVVAGNNGNDMMVARLADGSFVCSKDLSKAAYLPGNWPWNTPVMKALRSLGAITAGAMTRHLEHCEDVAKRQEHRYRAERLLQDLKEAGLTPTQEQDDYIHLHSRTKTAK